MNNEQKVVVIFEQQQHYVPQAIANDDEKLRALFAPFAPAAANAKIERIEGQPIKMLKQSGTKGMLSPSNPLNWLIQAPETVNPAIVMARQIQHLELSGQVTEQQMENLSQAIEIAIEQGKKAVYDYQDSLKALKKLPAAAGCLVIGF